MQFIQSLKDVLRPAVYYLPTRLRRWRRLRQIKSTRPIISKDRLVRDLSSLPVRRGAIVLVHSSLKALGYVSGGPATVSEALIEAFVCRNEGTVMLPTYTIAGSMHFALLSEERFDVEATVTNLGAIPEAFRHHPDAIRSIHPTHSFAAVGPDASWLVEDHHTCGSSFGPGSPMAKMLEKDSYLLGLGTNLGNVTFYHCLEEIEPDFPFNVYTADSPIAVECRGYDGEIHRIEVQAHDASVSRTRIDRPENEDIRNFFSRRFEEHAGMQWFQVGEAKCWLIEAARLYEEAKRLMDRGLTIYSTKSDAEAFEQRAEP